MNNRKNNSNPAKHPTSHQNILRPAFVLLLCLTIGLRGSPAFASPGNQASQPQTVILMLREQARLTTNIAEPGEAGKSQHRQAVLMALQTQANDSQSAALAQLEQMQADGTVEQVRPLWVANAIAVTAQPEALAALANLPGVAGVVQDTPLVMTDSQRVPVFQGPAPTTQINPPANLSQVNAPAMWQAGFTGKGVVVANVDSGVSLNNSDLKAKYRGGTNSWYDTHGEHVTPYDASYNSHGTATMGIMVSSAYGMAPDAQWMAVKLFSDSGTATIANALDAFQWLLDPDQNPLTADSPDVVNNSWSESSTGCVDNPAMHSALQALIAAGILPVFSAGNWGPNTSSDPFPSNYPEVLAVGAVDSSDMILGFSSRGPTACRPIGQFFPDLVAPGQNIPSTGSTDGSMVMLSGTSFSAPHAAGALALLLSAYPNLSAANQRSLLLSGALQVNGKPNDTYGYGRLNVNTTYSLATFEQGITAPNTYYLPSIAH